MVVVRHQMSERKCPAYINVCDECGKKGHFNKMCRFKMKGEVKAASSKQFIGSDSEEDEVLGSISGISGDGDVGGWLAL